jgi:hypothetical protein
MDPNQGNKQNCLLWGFYLFDLMLPVILLYAATFILNLLLIYCDTKCL